IEIAQPRLGGDDALEPSDQLAAFTHRMAPFWALTVSRRSGRCKPPSYSCCCNVKMSSPNCSVKRSSLNGDLHVEPEGTASAGAVEGAVWRAADECPGGRRPPDHCAAGPAAEAPVRGRGRRRARARQPRPSLAPG